MKEVVILREIALKAISLKMTTFFITADVNIILK